MTAPMALLTDLQTLVPGSTRVGGETVSCLRVHSDTRTLAAGDLFVALKGERFDAHSFLPQARAAGAVAALVSDPQALQASGLPGLVVSDTRQALGQLAAGWRARHHLPLIAVTGSNGKTTVTQMIAAILRAHVGDAALSTEGNLNNDIGVPLTLLRLRQAHRLAVVELGMNHPGEMASLAAMAQPTVALVNNAQREHQEFMSSVEAVARENGCVLQALDASGVAVFPHADAYTPLWRSLGGARPVLTFGQEGASVSVLSAHWQEGAWQLALQTPQGDATLRLFIAGRHNVVNAAAASAQAQAAGVPLSAIVAGLETFRPVKGRSRSFALAWPGCAEPVTVVDDTYNANPDSVRAAIDVLAELPSPQVLVLGDMGEVGDQGPAFHAEVGAYARQRGIARLLTLGEQSRAMAGEHHDSIESLLSALYQAVPGSGSVLVKGSRFMRMERVIQALADSGAAHTRKETGHVA